MNAAPTRQTEEHEKHRHRVLTHSERRCERANDGIFAGDGRAGKIARGASHFASQCGYSKSTFACPVFQASYGWYSATSLDARLRHFKDEIVGPRDECARIHGLDAAPAECSRVARVAKSERADAR